MTPDIEALLEALEVETRDLEAAVNAGDLERAGRALERRARRVEELALVLGDAPTGAAVGSVVEQVLASGRLVQEQLREQLTSARAELEAIRNAQRRAGAQSRSRVPARFVCERI